MRRVLVTGAHGFVGPVLCRQLEERGAEVVTPPRGFDVRDPSAVAELLSQQRPDQIVHLAAITHVPTSFREPVKTWEVNVIGTVNLLQAVREHCPQSLVLFVSSSEVYGETFKVGEPLDESRACRPMNPYAASKLAAELAVQQFVRSGGRALVARPFNHIGPGQSADFVAPSFALQIAEIEAGGKQPQLSVGNLDAHRDFLDVRDVAQAYCALLEMPDPVSGQVINISSGKARRVRDILDQLLALSDRVIDVVTDPERLRPSDIPFAVGDSSYLRAATGWSPCFDLKDTLSALLDRCRMEVKLVT